MTVTVAAMSARTVSHRALRFWVKRLRAKPVRPAMAVQMPMRVVPAEIHEIPVRQGEHRMLPIVAGRKQEIARGILSRKLISKKMDRIHAGFCLTVWANYTHRRD
jgi:hypothetical protein